MVEADSLAHFTATRKKIGFAHLASPLRIVFCQWHGYTPFTCRRPQVNLPI
jgi:hypothetical protein